MYTDNVVICIMQNINHQQVVYTHHFPQSGTVCSAMAELSSSICLGGRPLNMDTQSLAGDAGIEGDFSGVKDGWKNPDSTGF